MIYTSSRKSVIMVRESVICIIWAYPNAFFPLQMPTKKCKGSGYPLYLFCFLPTLNPHPKKQKRMPLLSLTQKNRPSK